MYVEGLVRRDERVEHYDNGHILPLLEVYTMFMRYFQTISFQEYYSAQGMKKKITDPIIVTFLY